jgi:hypothetical protein
VMSYLEVASACTMFKIKTNRPYDSRNTVSNVIIIIYL